MELEAIRQEIDAIDGELARLFRRRMQAVAAVAEAKRGSGAAVLDAAREEAVLARVADLAGADCAEDARQLFTTLMAISRRRQSALLAAQAADAEPERPPRALTIGIRGLGLIGGSFEKAFRRAGYEVVDLKAASSAVIGRCGLVIVCLPPLLVAPWICAHAADFAEGAIVTDAAGVKGVVCPAVGAVAKGARWTYVGGHPMAGKERSGYANADADLYRGASMILTPFADTPEAVLGTLKAIFAEIGFARFVVTDPAHHDEMIAYTSQLAHVVSSAYVRDPLSGSHLGFSAGSFQDMTRVATVDPDLWTDLFLANREPLETVLARLIDRLSEYQAAIRGQDAETLRRLLAEGRAAKEASC
ncbi:MAG: bifunctional chorismate mutase/prephenate dehydrogenase [Kiritimatiellia bacterium]